jgi:type I restriction enzyme S subunit
MQSNYKKIGKYVKQVSARNNDLSVTGLKGININKHFMPSVANINGTDLSKYRVVSKGQFAFNPMHVGRDEILPISMLEEDDKVVVSPAYVVFEIVDKNELLPEYLMMWCRRPEFDRNAWFTTDSSVRGGFSWSDFCDMNIPVPSPDKQREIVKEYNVIVNRIKLNEHLNQKLEETAQAIYKQWFVDEQCENNPVKLSSYILFNPKHSIQKKSIVSYIEMADLQESHMSIRGKIKRPFSAGSKFINEDTLLARITPCLENGKTAFINTLCENEVAYGSTEFIVMRAKQETSPYWVYCLARDGNFREYAISSMVGSSGRQRVHSDYLEEYLISEINPEKMSHFHDLMKPIFRRIKNNAQENSQLYELSSLVLAGVASNDIKEIAA